MKMNNVMDVAKMLDKEAAHAFIDEMSKRSEELENSKVKGLQLEELATKARLAQAKPEKH